MAVVNILLGIAIAATVTATPQFHHNYEQPVPHKYAFGVNSPYTGDQKEHKHYTSPSGYTEGEYRWLQPNGLFRVIRYTVDGDSGFKAIVSEEPGDQPQNYQFTTGGSKGTSHSGIGHLHHKASSSVLPSAVNHKANKPYVTGLSFHKASTPYLSHHKAVNPVVGGRVNQKAPGKYAGSVTKGPIHHNIKSQVVHLPEKPLGNLHNIHHKGFVGKAHIPNRVHSTIGPSVIGATSFQNQDHTGGLTSIQKFGNKGASLKGIADMLNKSIFGGGLTDISSLSGLGAFSQPIRTSGIAGSSFGSGFKNLGNLSPELGPLPPVVNTFRTKGPKPIKSSSHSITSIHSSVNEGFGSKLPRIPNKGGPDGFDSSFNIGVGNVGPNNLGLGPAGQTGGLSINPSVTPVPSVLGSSTPGSSFSTVGGSNPSFGNIDLGPASFGFTPIPTPNPSPFSNGVGLTPGLFDLNVTPTPNAFDLGSVPGGFGSGLTQSGLGAGPGVKVTQAPNIFDTGHGFTPVPGNFGSGNIGPGLSITPTPSGLGLHPAGIGSGPGAFGAGISPSSADLISNVNNFGAEANGFGSGLTPKPASTGLGVTPPPNVGGLGVTNFEARPNSFGPAFTPTPQSFGVDGLGLGVTPTPGDIGLGPIGFSGGQNIVGTGITPTPNIAVGAGLGGPGLGIIPSNIGIGLGPNSFDTGLDSFGAGVIPNPTGHDFSQEFFRPGPDSFRGGLTPTLSDLPLTPSTLSPGSGAFSSGVSLLPNDFALSSTLIPGPNSFGSGGPPLTAGLGSKANTLGPNHAGTGGGIPPNPGNLGLGQVNTNGGFSRFTLGSSNFGSSLNSGHNEFGGVFGNVGNNPAGFGSLRFDGVGDGRGISVALAGSPKVRRSD